MSDHGPGLVLVLSSFPEGPQAQELARALVSERLAACVQVSAPIASTYIWKGVLETAQEVMLHCKTTSERAEALAARLGALHPYATPEIVTITADACHPAYLAWVRENTAAGESA